MGRGAALTDTPSRSVNTTVKTHMAAAPSPDTTDANAPRHERDVNCAACGYNLRGLPIDADCPECGQTPEPQLRDDWLDQTDPHWRHKLARGGKLLHFGTIAALPLIYPGVMIALVGLYQLTSPQPGRDEPRDDRRARQIARMFVLLAGLGLIALTCLFFLSRQPLLGKWTLFDAMSIAVHAVLAIGMLATWDYLQILAHRLPDPHLARHCSRIRVDWTVAVTGIFFVGLISTTLDTLGLSRLVPSHITPILAGVAILCVLAILCWLWVRTLVFAAHFRRRLNNSL